VIAYDDRPPQCRVSSLGSAIDTWIHASVPVLASQADEVAVRRSSTPVAVAADPAIADRAPPWFAGY